MFKEYDIVEAACDLGGRITPGTRGAILMVYPGQNSMFEVEFVDDVGRTIEVRSAVRADQIRLVQRPLE